VNDVRLAATVILARSPFEVYLTRRSARSAFAPDAFVFPGGTVEPQDSHTAMRERAVGLDAERVSEEFRATIPAALSTSEPAVDADAGRALLVAAVRELFEEAGVLLACDAAKHGAGVTAADLEAAAGDRVALRSGELAFSEYLRRRDWFADTRALTLFSHWITPLREPRRYNTHFFFALAPPNQAAQADAYETHDGVWIPPSLALERYRDGEMHLVYPTIKHLERLALFDSPHQAQRFARSKPVLTIMPTDDDDEFAIPPLLENVW
jgi:8-oxo-dGTP pyrophosphatase MutT (NUDIX family)